MDRHSNKTPFLCFRAKSSVATAKDRKASRREKDDARLTKLMLLIFICFLLCFLPLMMMNVFDDDVRYPVLHVLASILAWASSVINPFIYAATNKQYRSAYARLLHFLRTSVTLTFSVDSKDNKVQHQPQAVAAVTSTTSKEKSHPCNYVSLRPNVDPEMGTPKV